MSFAYEWILSGSSLELLLVYTKMGNSNSMISMEMAIMRKVLLLDCILCTRIHVLWNHRDFSLLATNCGFWHELKNALASYGCEEKTERGWGGELCEGKDINTHLQPQWAFIEPIKAIARTLRRGRFLSELSIGAAASWSCCLAPVVRALCSLLLPVVFSVVTENAWAALKILQKSLDLGSFRARGLLLST